MSDRKSKSHGIYEGMVLQETLAQLADQEGKLRAHAYVKESAAARIEHQIQSDATLKPDVRDKGFVEIQKNLDIARTARVEADEINKRAQSVLERLDAVETEQAGEPVLIEPKHQEFDWDDVVQTMHEVAEKAPEIKEAYWFSYVSLLESGPEDARRNFLNGIVKYGWSVELTAQMSAVAGVCSHLLAHGTATPLKEKGSA